MPGILRGDVVTARKRNTAQSTVDESRRDFLKLVAALSAAGLVAATGLKHIAEALAYSPKTPTTVITPETLKAAYEADVIIKREGPYAVAVDREGRIIAKSTDHAKVVQEAVDLGNNIIVDGCFNVLEFKSPVYIRRVVTLRHFIIKAYDTPFIIDTKTYVETFGKAFENCRFRDIIIDMSEAEGKTAFDVRTVNESGYNVDHFEFRNIYIYGVSGIGFWLKRVEFSTFDNITVVCKGKGIGVGFRLGDYDGIFTDNCVFININVPAAKTCIHWVFGHANVFVMAKLGGAEVGIYLGEEGNEDRCRVRWPTFINPSFEDIDVAVKVRINTSTSDPGVMINPNFWNVQTQYDPADYPRPVIFSARDGLLGHYWWYIYTHKIRGHLVVHDVDNEVRVYSKDLSTIVAKIKNDGRITIKKIDVGDFGGNFANYTPPSDAEDGDIWIAVDTNSSAPGARLYIKANGQIYYINLSS